MRAACLTVLYRTDFRSFFDYSVGSEVTRPEVPKGEAGLLEVAGTHDSRLRSSSRDLLPLSLSRSLGRRRESYVRSQGFSMLETESASKFLEKIEHEVVPLLRKQKGFLDQLTILSDSGEIIYGGAAVSGRDVWSVGTYADSSGSLQTLAEHWNGSYWSIVATR